RIKYEGSDVFQSSEYYMRSKDTLSIDELEELEGDLIKDIIKLVKEETVIEDVISEARDLHNKKIKTDEEDIISRIVLENTPRGKPEKIIPEFEQKIYLSDRVFKNKLNGFRGVYYEPNRVMKITPKEIENGIRFRTDMAAVARLLRNVSTKSFVTLAMLYNADELITVMKEVVSKGSTLSTLMNRFNKSIETLGIQIESREDTYILISDKPRYSEKFINIVAVKPPRNGLPRECRLISIVKNSKGLLTVEESNVREIRELSHLGTLIKIKGYAPTKRKTFIGVEPVKRDTPTQVISSRVTGETPPGLREAESFSELKTVLVDKTQSEKRGSSLSKGRGSDKYLKTWMGFQEIPYNRMERAWVSDSKRRKAF
ncbi:MAG: hypothetical protein KAU03_03910, partial [Candidatus Altiarchaeales archaeon]|nr:hypothetical protein [Candidatus Altiarchaeales archaeon]